MDQPERKSVSIFFYAGDFADVLRRYEAGVPQVYATHNEVARLMLDLLAAGVRTTIYSYVSPTPKSETPRDGLTIVSLGAANGNVKGVLRDAVERDRSATLIAHMPYPELIRAATRSRRNVFVTFANSYNGGGLRQWFRKRRIARLLNDPRIAMVSNHFRPATEHLAEMGVERTKLVPWDIPHEYRPADHAAKTLGARDRATIAYAGSIAELKGVGDLIRAAAELNERGITVELRLAGGGDIEPMTRLAADLGVADRVRFEGVVGNDRVFAFFRAADLVAVPSRTAYPEGFPLTLFEAIASRSPVVCSDHPMFTPVLKDGISAALFPSGDAKALADAIARVLTDPGLYARLSDNAEATWADLGGCADWRTLMFKWATEGANSTWVRERRLPAA